MENRQRKLNNEGFSLIELIVVIAIMAILTGVIAMNLPQFTGKAKKSTDTQLADTVKESIQLALIDPDVNDAPKAAAGAKITLDFADKTTFNSYPNFGKALAGYLEYTSVDDMTKATGITSKLQSVKTKACTATIDENNKVVVTVGAAADGDAIVID